MLARHTGPVLLLVVMVICSPALAVLSGLSQPAAAQGGICVQGGFVTLDNVGSMVESDFFCPAGYNFEFVYGSKDICDGSDFDAVRGAFGTWLDLPSSDIFAGESSCGYRLDPSRTNGRNEISWLGFDDSGTDLWHDVLGFSSNVIAAVVTWYYQSTGKVVERDMYFNDVDMSWFTDTDGSSAGAFYVEHIALHEIGHIYGLKDLYNPGQAGYESWMGSCNSALTMYGYSHCGQMDITLSELDIYAMALAHPASVPEPHTFAFFGVAAGCFVVTTGRRGRL